MTKRLGVFVKNASRDSVVDSFKLIKNNYLPQSKLITNYNQLNGDAIAAIKRHHDANKAFELRSNDVRTYISASSISHLLDGWGYLSQAVNALLAGNSGAAIHLAYYAELRAVMSLLASEGIGVFSNQHIGIDANNDFNFFSKYKRRERGGSGSYITKENKIGTHVFAWEAFDKWCKSDVKPSYNLLRIFKVKGHTFSDLLPGFHPQATQLVSSSIAKQWLKKWAFDVKRYKNDRDLRNFVSYRPQTISNFDSRIDFKESINNIYSLFHVLSPNSSSPFNYLDKLLLKKLFEELYSIEGISERGSLKELIEESFSHLGATLDATTERILLPQGNQETHLIFSEASKRKVSALPLISRASLLLRVSTGCTSVLLEDAQIRKDELNFIWGNYGFNNGFWEVAKPVSDFFELWTDVETKFSEITDELDFQSNNAFTLRNELGDLNSLSQFNRAGLWGLAM